MLMNIMVNHFANNYSNIFIPGYLYNLRRISMSRGEGEIQLRAIRTKNVILYFQLFNKFIKQFEKNRKCIYYEIKRLSKYIYYVKELSLTQQEKDVKVLLNEILDDYYADKYFKIFVNKLLLYLEEDHNNLFYDL